MFIAWRISLMAVTSFLKLRYQYSTYGPSFIEMVKPLLSRSARLSGGIQSIMSVSPALSAEMAACESGMMRQMIFSSSALSSPQ